MERLAGEKLPDDVNPFRVKVDRKAGTAFHKDVGLLQGQFVRKVDRYSGFQGAQDGWLGRDHRERTAKRKSRSNDGLA